MHCVNEKNQSGMPRPQLRKAFAGLRQLGTWTLQPWETKESGASTVPSETGEIKGGSTSLNALSLKTRGFINWQRFKGRLICPRASCSLSGGSRAGVPGIHCKGGEGATLFPDRRVCQAVSVPRAAKPVSPPFQGGSLVLGPTCWWDLRSLLHSSLLHFLNYFSPESLLIFCFHHISKTGGFCEGFFFFNCFFFPCFFNDSFYFSLVCEWNTYRRKRPLMAVITRQRTPNNKES